MATSQPFFSIIIPTRNRYDTLPYAMKTVLKQDFASYELIISDNSDEANLSELEPMQSLMEDPRVRYVRPSSVLAMSDHWDFALSNAKGEYIILFGDDDGLVVGALEHIHWIIQKTSTQLVSWHRVEYSWPERLPAEYANLLIVPYVSKTGLIDGEKYIKGILAHLEDYRSLPMLYNSAVSKDLIGKLKEKTGRIFSAVSPDLYSGYAFAHLSKQYISVGYPLSINGVSARSNGAAHQSKNDLVKADFWALLKESKIRWPEELPELMISYIAIVEPFIQLKRFFPELDAYITRKEIYRNFISRLKATSEAELTVSRQKILASTESDPAFHAWVGKQLRKIKPAIVPPGAPAYYEEEIGFNGSHLTLDGSKFGLKNVDDVAVFIRNLFGKPKDLDFLKPVTMPMAQRIRKAAGIILRPI